MIHRLSLKNQLGLGFALVVALFVLTLMLIAQRVAHLEKGMRQLGEDDLPMLLAVDEMNLQRAEVQQFLTDVGATHDPAGLREADAAVQAFRTASAQVRAVLTQETMPSSCARWTPSTPISRPSTPPARPWPKPTCEKARRRATA